MEDDLKSSKAAKYSLKYLWDYSQLSMITQQQANPADPEIGTASPQLVSLFLFLLYFGLCLISAKLLLSKLPNNGFHYWSERLACAVTELSVHY